MIKIRLTRQGRKKAPLFTIVATDSRARRDGNYIEKLGQYSPSDEKSLSNVSVEAIKGWMSKGAELSDTVRTLFKKNNIKL